MDRSSGLLCGASNGPNKTGPAPADPLEFAFDKAQVFADRHGTYRREDNHHESTNGQVNWTFSQVLVAHRVTNRQFIPSRWETSPSISLMPTTCQWPSRSTTSRGSTKFSPRPDRLTVAPTTDKESSMASTYSAPM